MSIRTIIVDDVELARERIKMILAEDDVEIVAECGNGNEAIRSIRQLNPELVLLDVQMPMVDGFEVLEQIGPENMPVVIFITAFDKFALRAFEVNAIDYILKPVDEERLREAVNRARLRIGQLHASDEIDERLRRLLREVKNESQFLKWIPIKSSRGTTFVLAADVDWISSAGHYLELHIGSETHLVRRKLSEIETKLDPQNFARIHRSTIVNITRIKSLHPLFNDDHLVVLKNGCELNLSRTYYNHLMLRL